MKSKIIITIAVMIIAILLAISMGSVTVPIYEILRIIFNRIFGMGSISDISSTSEAIIWNLRLPRALLAFIVGAMLSVSGAIMQSVLRNPLASSFTLGVSSGASLGAALVIFFGISFLPSLTLPAAGFVLGMGTMMLAIVFASRIDGMLENNTIILMGMVMSLFINAITTLLMAIQRESAQQLIFWQMGSLSSRGWDPLAILLPVMIIGIFIAIFHHRELDLMTFGEDTARTIGVSIVRTKWILLIVAASMTGSAIAFVGIIGFIDLIAPHIVRRIFGPRHIILIPLSAIVGGSIMALSDLVARTITSPAELPIGVVTALIGAPFFAYIYFAGRRRRNA